MVAPRGLFTASLQAKSTRKTTPHCFPCFAWAERERHRPASSKSPAWSPIQSYYLFSDQSGLKPRNPKVTFKNEEENRLVYIVHCCSTAGLSSVVGPHQWSPPAISAERPKAAVQHRYLWSDMRSLVNTSAVPTCNSIGITGSSSWCLPAL